MGEAGKTVILAGGQYAETNCRLAGKNQRGQHADRAVSRKYGCHCIRFAAIWSYHNNSKEAVTMTASILFYAGVTAVALFGIYLAYRRT